MGEGGGVRKRERHTRYRERGREGERGVQRERVNDRE